MKSNLGKALSKKEMKAVRGGKLPGCARINEEADVYAQGCCSGLSQCPVPSQICEPLSDPCHGV